MSGSVFAELTTRCNARCGHCDYWAGPRSIMADHTVQALLSKCLAQPPHEIVLTGGEPTLHPDFGGIVQRLSEAGAPLKLATNGTTLASAPVAATLGWIDEVVVSLDACSAGTYLRVRGVDRFDYIVEALARTKAAFPGIRLVGSFLVQSKNFRELDQLPALADRVGLNRVAVLVPNLGGDFQRNKALDDYSRELFLSDEEKAEFQQVCEPVLHDDSELGSLVRRTGRLRAVFHHMMTDGALSTGNRRNRPCSLPTESIFAYADGSVAFCPFWGPRTRWRSNGEIVDELATRSSYFFDRDSARTYCTSCLEVST